MLCYSKDGLFTSLHHPALRGPAGPEAVKLFKVKWEPSPRPHRLAVGTLALHLGSGQSSSAHRGDGDLGSLRGSLREGSGQETVPQGFPPCPLWGEDTISSGMSPLGP